MRGEIVRRLKVAQRNDGAPMEKEGGMQRGQNLKLAVLIPLAAILITVASIVIIGELLLFVSSTIGGTAAILVAVAIMAAITVVAVLLSRSGSRSEARHS
jgi:hypothetical protein